MNTGLDICPLNGLGFMECPTGQYKVTGSILFAKTYDFTPAITEPFWALGFSSLGNSYPNQVNIEQAFYFTSLQVYPSTLPKPSPTVAQFNDAYETPSGLVQTKWQIAFDHANKLITVQNLMTKLPQVSSYRACTEILLNYWKLNSFSYSQAPQQIILPY